MPGIDHLYIHVDDLDAAASAMRAIGFSVSAKGHHLGRGTANHLIMFADTYLELIGVEEGARPPDFLGDATGSRLWGVALHTVDIALDRDRLARLAIPVAPTERLERPLGEIGSDAIARFDVAAIDVGGLVEGYFFYCAHLTPDLIWRDGVGNHDIPAVMEGLLIASATPSSTTRRLDAIIRGDADAHAGRIHDIDLIVEPHPSVPDESNPHSADDVATLIGIQFVTDDLPGVRQRLAAGGCDVVDHGTHVDARCEPLGHTVLRFVAAG